MKKQIKILAKLAGGLFLLLNMLSAVHAYKFTHYDCHSKVSVRNPEKLSMQQKLKVLFLGVSLPRPEIHEIPTIKYQTVIVNHELECWDIDVPNSKGVVLLFHGYGSNKSSVLGKSQEFNRLGYSTFLVDFKGSGGSISNTTTIGYYEAKDVATCFKYIKERGAKNIILCGTSMGAVAVMKSVSEEKISPNCIILECPFGSMLQTVTNRFDAMGIPAFPFAHLLLFYGGVMNGFWAFSHNPIDYAKKIHIPTLLLCGGQDERVTESEINQIYINLAGQKQKVIYANAGHESYLRNYRKEWREDVACFLERE